MNKLIPKMISQAHQALSRAYAPYSKFTVAASICTDTGAIYTGVNIENASYGLTLCAEAAALSAMVCAGEQRIKHIVILAGNNLLCPPCGACRQRIQEFSTPETLIHLCDKETILRSITINELLPLAFNFKP